MTTITITLPTNKAGVKAIYKIQFQSCDFDKVVEAVENIKTHEELKSNSLWTIK